MRLLMSDEESLISDTLWARGSKRPEMQMQHAVKNWSSKDVSAILILKR